MARAVKQMCSALMNGGNVQKYNPPVLSVVSCTAEEPRETCSKLWNEEMRGESDGSPRHENEEIAW